MFDEVAKFGFDLGHPDCAYGIWNCRIGGPKLDGKSRNQAIPAPSDRSCSIAYTMFSENREGME